MPKVSYFFGPYRDKKGCYSTCVEDENVTLPQILFSAPRNKIKKLTRTINGRLYCYHKLLLKHLRI